MREDEIHNGDKVIFVKGTVNNKALNDDFRNELKAYGEDSIFTINNEIDGSMIGEYHFDEIVKGDDWSTNWSCDSSQLESATGYKKYIKLRGLYE